MNKRCIKSLGKTALIPGFISLSIGILALSGFHHYNLMINILLVCFGWIFGYFIFCVNVYPALGGKHQ